MIELLHVILVRVGVYINGWHRFVVFVFVFVSVSRTHVDIYFTTSHGIDSLSGRLY